LPPVATYARAPGRMRHRHDSFTKKFVRRVLDSEGTFTAEMEVSPDAQRVDGYFVPHLVHNWRAAGT
jgi:hypothetical protein